MRINVAVLAVVVVVTHAAPNSTFISSAWFAGWHAQDAPLDMLSWSKYTHLFYAFATTTSDPHVLSLQPSDTLLLPQFVQLAHQNGVKASLSIGGWTGSRWFSSNLATPANRSAFVNTVLSLVQHYNLDGIDFDWEFPGYPALECNILNPNDTSNFLSFLQLLRSKPPAANLILSAPTSIVPFATPAGSPSSNSSLSPFANVLDFISIMNYDIWRPTLSPLTGPSSPLNDSCVPPGQQRNGSAVSSVQAWTNAGIPLHQIVLGVPAYGHSFNVSLADAHPNASDQLSIYTPFNATGQPSGDKWDNLAGLDTCGNPIGVGGVWQFWGLIKAGYLNPSDGTPAAGFGSRYDNCSQTPYLYNESAHILISYDSPRSYAAKGMFIRSVGLRGFAMWEAGGDYNDTLLDAIMAAALDGDDPFTKTPVSFSASSIYRPSFVLALGLVAALTSLLV